MRSRRQVWFEYAAIIEPLVKPTIALWRMGDERRDADGQRTDIYCWGYNRGGFDCSQDGFPPPEQGRRLAQNGAHDATGASWLGVDGNGTLGGFGGGRQLGTGVDDAASPMLLALRWWRSISYRVLFIGLRWLTPVLLSFADTVLMCAAEPSPPTSAQSCPCPSLPPLLSPALALSPTAATSVSPQVPLRGGLLLGASRRLAAHLSRHHLGSGDTPPAGSQGCAPVFVPCAGPRS